MEKKISLLFIACVLSICSYAQINTPSGATIPFGSNIAANASPYSYGIVPTNLPAGAYTPGSGLYGKSQDAYTIYNTWKTNYAVDCGSGAWRIKFDTPSQTVSEGIGYGMLLAAYAADKTLFDGLWTFYKSYKDSKGLMDWKANGCPGSGVGGSGAATDADLDVAMALLIAEFQWPAYTSPYDYKTEADAIITAIGTNEIDQSNYNGHNYGTLPGDSWGSGGLNTRNPGYLSPAYYTEFAKELTGQATLWNGAATEAYRCLNANRNTTTGLVGDWSDASGTPTTNTYGYEACRNPYRLAVDVIWHGNTTAQTNFCIPIAGYVNGKGAASVGGNMSPAGGTGTHNALFVATFAAGIVGSNATYQTLLNAMYNETIAQQDALPLYFGNTLRAISMFIMTGNFWKPGLVCPTANINSGASTGTLCGLSFPSPGFVINSGLANTTSKTITWYKDGTVLGAAANTLSYTISSSSATGTYKVQVDSAGGCSKFDTIVIDNSVPAVNLGSTQTICTPATVLLDAGVSGSGITYQWSADNVAPYNLAGVVALSAATNQTLANVRAAGFYVVTVSKSGCGSSTGSVQVNSNLPTPVDGCAGSGPAGVALSIANPGLVGTNYDWYSVASGGSPVATSTVSYMPTVSATTTYYVQDKSGSSVYVGKSALGGSTWNVNDFTTSDKILQLSVLQNLTIDSVTVYLAAAGNVTVNVMNGATVAGTKTITGLAAGKQRIGLGFALTTGTYLIDGNGTTVQLSMDNANAVFPYTAAGVMSVSNNPAASWASTWYALFYNFKVSTGNVCSRLPVIANITAACGCSLPGTAGSITGTTAICANATGQTFSIASVSGAASYSWSVPTGAVITGGLNTNSITVTMGSSSGTVTVTPVNACGNGGPASTSITVTANVVPAVTAGASQTTICSGTNVTFTATPANGGTTPGYQWRKNSSNIAGANAATYNTTTIANNDKFDVVLTSNATCASPATATSSQVTITIASSLTASVTISVAPGTTIYAGQSVTFTAVPVNGGTSPTYQWRKNTSAIGSATSAAYTTSTAVNGDSYDVVMTSNSSCVSLPVVTSNSILMIVNPEPVFDNTISGPASASGGQTGVAYSVTNQPGMTYVWSVPPGATIVSGQGTNAIVVNFGSGSGTVSLTETNPLGQGSTVSLPVTVATTTAVYGATSVEKVILAYPIPCQEKLTIELQNQDNTAVSYSIVNMTGTIVSSGSFSYEGVPVQLNADFGSGLYLVVLNWDNKVSSVRITKK